VKVIRHDRHLAESVAELLFEPVGGRRPKFVERHGSTRPFGSARHGKPIRGCAGNPAEPLSRSHSIVTNILFS
jgi:hypothetical protein